MLCNIRCVVQKITEFKIVGKLQWCKRNKNINRMCALKKQNKKNNDPLQCVNYDTWHHPIMHYTLFSYNSMRLGILFLSLGSPDT